MLADLLRFAGRVDDALRARDEGFAHAEQYGEGGYLAELRRAKAELLRLQGDIAGAEAEFAAAVEYARGQQARSFELRAATGWAQLLIASGRHADARAVLEPVYAWFTEGLGTADLVRGTRDARADSLRTSTSKDPGSLVIGRNISHYRIIEQLGAGGMGQVYLAEDVRLGRKVAMKVLASKLVTDQDRGTSVRAGSASGLGPESSEHSHDSRHRAGRRHSLHRDRVRRW